MQDILQFIHTHWVLSTAFTVVSLTLMVIEYLRLKRNATQLSPAQATQMINHQNGLIVDIRSIEAFATGHIVGALSLPFSELENKIQKLEKFKTQPLIITCAAGLESARAAAILIKQGFNQVYILASGIRSWRDAGMPLTKE